MTLPTQPIGIFDSGIGGLTIARALVNLMPQENIIYFGDTAHLPYGDKSPETLQAHALRITDFLLAKQCKLILIACNSAASAASPQVRAHVKDKALVMDVIDPLIQSLTPTHHKIGLIGTRQTVHSGIYRQKLEAAFPGLQLVCRATNLLASAIEEFGSSTVTDSLIREYLSDPVLEGIESLILACTHYPLIKENIRAFFDGAIDVIDPSDTVARAALRLLTDNNLRNPGGTGKKHFYVSDLTDSFADKARFFFSDTIHLEHLPLEKPYELSPQLACREFC